MCPCGMGTFGYTVLPGDTLWMIARRYNTTVNAIYAANRGVNLNFLYIGQVICIPSDTVKEKGCPGKAEAEFRNKIRELWEQHSAWTRMTIISMAANAPDTELVTNRLLRNPSDFALALKPFYGNDKASRFEALLKTHLVTAAQIVKAAKAGNNKAAADYEKDWYANADEIAEFLASINPYWSESEWKNMLHEHLKLVKAEAVARLNRNFAEDIRLYDVLEQQALEMADMMSEGIVKQFPAKF
jgi:LysM repeat protein